MDPLRRLSLLFLIAGSLLVIGVDCSWSQSPLTAKEVSSEQRTNSPQQASGQDKPAKSLWQQMTSDPVAVLTLGIVALTLILAVSTAGLWIMAIRTARRQLRAYMAVDSARATQLGRGLVVTLEFVNSGQTPAYGVYVLSETGIHAKQALLPWGWWLRWSLQKTDKRVIGPAVRHHHTKIIEGTADEIAALRNGDQRGFIWGRLKYRDAFGQRRYLRFTYRTGLDEDDRWIMQPTKGGEKAN